MNSKKKSRPNTSNPKSGRKEEEKTVVPDGVYLNSRFMHTITSLIGNTVQLHLSNGKIVEGIFTTFSPQFAIVLEMAHHVDPSQPGQIRVETVEERLVCPSQNVITMTSQDVELDYASRDAFATDTAISSRFNGQRAGEKELEPWEADSSDGVDISLDSETNGWDATDMFERNERIYGVTTTFDCSLSQYTTKLEHRDTQDYKELEARAAKIANIIDSSVQSREAAELENSDDEEEKFSAVIRSSSGSQQQQQQQPSHAYSKPDNSSPSYSSPTSSLHGPSSLQQPGPGKYVPPAKRKNPQMGKLTRGNTPSPRQGPYYDESLGKHGQTYSQNQGPSPGYYQGSNRSNASPTSYGHAHGHGMPPHGHGMPPHGPKNVPSQDARLNGDERRNEPKSNEPPRGRDSHYDRHGSENRGLPKQDGSSSHGDSNQHGPPARNLDNRKSGPAHKSRDDQANELKKFGHDFRLGEAPQPPASHHQPPQQQQQQQIHPPPQTQLPPVSSASQQDEKRRPSPAPVTTPTAAATAAASVPASSKSGSSHGALPPASAASPAAATPTAPGPAASSPEGKVTPATTPTSNQTASTSAASNPSQEKPDDETEKLTSTLKKSSLNPNAKEFVLNPNAKAFTPRSPSTPTPPRSHTPQTGPVPMGPGSLPGPAVGPVPQPLPMMPTLMVPSYVAAAAAAAAQGQATTQGAMNPGQPGGHMPGATPSPGQPPYGPTPNQNPRFRKAVPLNVSNSHRPELTSPMHVAAATGQPLLAPAPMQGPGFAVYTPQGHLVSGGPQPYTQMYMPMRVVTPQGNMLVPTSMAYTDSPGSGHGGPMYMSQQGPASGPGGHQNPLQPPPQQHHHPHHHHPNPAPSPGHPQVATPTPSHNQQQIMYPAAAAAAAAAQHGPHAPNAHGHGQMHAQHLHSQNHAPPPHPHPHSFPTMMFLPPAHTGQMPPGAGAMAGVHGGPQMAQLLSLGGSPAGVFPMPHTIQFISQAPGPGGQPSHMQSLVPHNQ